MEIKHSTLWSYILCQALLVIPSKSHSNNGSLGNIEFVCPQGQYFTGGFCIMPVDVEMDWWSARRTCERHGYYLFWADDVDDYIAIDHLARSSWTNYWSGLYMYDIGGPKWVYKSKEAPLYEVLWENGQPAADAYQYCVYAKKNGYYSFGNCLQKLPFICKSHAVLKDYFRCRNGEGIKQEFVCDGHNDCGDFTDEIKCGINTPQCSGVVDAQTVNSGSISSSGVYGSSKSCYWTIVAGVGQTIKVTIKTFGTERSADILHLRTGGMGGDIYLGELTGTAVNPLPTYYSSDNVFILRLITDNTIESTGFTIDWTTNVPEVFNDVKMLRAGNSVEDLKSPFYDSGYLPHEKVLEWVITADTNHVVTLEFVDIKIGDSGQLFLWDSGDKTQVPTLNGVQEFKSSIYISKSKSVRLMLRSEGGGIAAFNKGLYVRYWEGCNVNHQLNEGTIQSPGYLAGNYPDNVNCQWSMRRPQGETRPISLRFKSFDLQSESDHLKIFNDSASSVSSSPLHTGDGFNGLDDLANMVVHSTTGSIWIKFETNAVLTAKGFEAEFSVDCPAIVVSSYTSISSNEMYETSFRSEVILTCDTGYSFKQEEFNKMSSVTIMCEKGGKWNVSRIPDCMITFCPIPPNIENGYISISSGVMYGANVTYECNDGFSLNQNNVIECMENGAWSSAPTCQAEQCPTLTAPTNGGIEKLEGDGTEFASVVRFTCDEGYDLIGNLTIYCKTGGEWSHERPVCERIWCPLPVIHDGSLNLLDDMRFGTSATLTCDTGYGINGTTTPSTSVTCGADGRIEFIPCMDIDECDTSTNNCGEIENCNNINGSFVCTCKDGYEKLSTEAPCTVTKSAEKWKADEEANTEFADMDLKHERNVRIPSSNRGEKN